jgi:aspartate oxidase
MLHTLYGRSLAFDTTLLNTFAWIYMNGGGTQHGEHSPRYAENTVLATGVRSRLFSVPISAYLYTGDSNAMAMRKDFRIRHEFILHPTECTVPMFDY